MARVKQSSHPTKHYSDSIPRYAEGGVVDTGEESPEENGFTARLKRAANKVVDFAAEVTRPQAGKDAAAEQKRRTEEYNKRNKEYQAIWGPHVNLPVDPPKKK